MSEKIEQYEAWEEEMKAVIDDRAAKIEEIAQLGEENEQLQVYILDFVFYLRNCIIIMIKPMYSNT